MPRAFELTPQHREDFERDGVFRLRGFYAPQAVAQMAQTLWADLGRRFQIDPQRPETWKNKQPGKFQRLQHSGAFAAMNSPQLATLGDAFLGEGRWQAQKQGGHPLVTFPNGAWDIPHRNWHLDMPATGLRGALTALRVFTFLEPVQPRGGGTLYVSGSHRMVAALANEVPADAPVRSAELKAALGPADPWFADLFQPEGEDRIQRFLEEGAVVRGVPVKVEEMTGEPGDVMVMHPAVLHTFAPNARDRPRLMLVTTLFVG